MLVRLWHKDLISVLPRQQLLGQWRELFAIYRDMKREYHGERKKSAYAHKHPLVKYVNDYPIEHLLSYGNLLYLEMQKRGYSANHNLVEEIKTNSIISFEVLFNQNHTELYLEICYFNLKEKYLSGMISKDEWNLIESKIKSII